MINYYVEWIIDLLKGQEEGIKVEHKLLMLYFGKLCHGEHFLDALNCQVRCYLGSFFRYYVTKAYESLFTTDFLDTTDDLVVLDTLIYFIATITRLFHIRLGWCSARF